MATQPVLSLVRPLPVHDPRSVDFMLKDLARSGLVPEDLGAFPIELQALATTPAYVIPYQCSDRMYRIRFDRKTDKYIQPKGIVGVWWSPKQSPAAFASAPIIYIIEGEKKTAAFVKKWPHLPAFGIGGAHMAVVKGDNGIHRLHDDFLRYIPSGKTVHIIFDGDIEEKTNIQTAATNFKDACSAVKIELKVFRPPTGKGVDDWLVETPGAALDQLVLIDAEKLAASKRALAVKLKLKTNEDGVVLNTANNITSLLTYYFRDRVYIDKRLGTIRNGERCDLATLMMENLKFIADNWISAVSFTNIKQATELALQSNRKDLVKEYLLEQKWDGIKRLDTWGANHIHSDMPSYANEWGRLLMTGMAFRISDPGCKFDYVPILVGAQGIGKSTFFEDLSMFMGEQFYTSVSDISSGANDSNRTQGALFAKSTVVDLGEGTVFQARKTSIDQLKQLITLTVDEYRVAHAQFPTVAPRSFIFVGTTNRPDQLSDATGSRRFLMLRTTKIIKLPYQIKLQILAEAIARREELEQRIWYEMQIDITQLPQELQDANPHIHDAQALVNAQFTRADATTDDILAFIESGLAPAYRDNRGEYFISSIALANFIGDNSPRNRNFINRILESAAASPTFPYQLKSRIRVRVNQLEFIGDMNQLFRTNPVIALKDTTMIQGYAARKRT